MTSLSATNDREQANIAT